MTAFVATAEQCETSWRLKRELLDVMEERLSILRFGDVWESDNGMFAFQTQRDLGRFNANVHRLDEILDRQARLAEEMQRITQELVARESGTRV